jgi:hypothetical protein
VIKRPPPLTALSFNLLASSFSSDMHVVHMLIDRSPSNPKLS